MMPTTPELMKFKRLQRRLGESIRGTVGLLEMLWIQVSKNCPRGDIGRFSNEEIAIMVDWDGDPDLLVGVLVECGWLDDCAVHRVVVHDWATHSPKWVKGNVTQHMGGFAAASPKDCPLGSVPRGVSPKEPPCHTQGGSPKDRPPVQSNPVQSNPTQSKEVSKDTSRSEPCSDPTNDSGFVFALQSGGWHLPEKKLAEYVATYKFDVQQELLKAAQWLRDNKDRRPRSGTGVTKFLTRWMNRHSDKIPANAKLSGRIPVDNSLKAEMARAKAIREARANGQVSNIP